MPLSRRPGLLGSSLKPRAGQRAWPTAQHTDGEQECSWPSGLWSDTPGDTQPVAPPVQNGGPGSRRERGARRWGDLALSRPPQGRAHPQAAKCRSAGPSLQPTRGSAAKHGETFSVSPTDAPQASPKLTWVAPPRRSGLRGEERPRYPRGAWHRPGDLSRPLETPQGTASAPGAGRRPGEGPPGVRGPAPAPSTYPRCSRSCRRGSLSGDSSGGGWTRGRSRGPSGRARYPWHARAGLVTPGVGSGPRTGTAGSLAWPRAVAPPPRPAPAPAPEQHAGHGEVREAADAPRHQLQVGVRHRGVSAG